MKVTKEMFVHEKALSGINNELYNIVFSTTKTDSYAKSVTVSYEIDRKIEITDSQFEKAWDELTEYDGHMTGFEFLKKRLFGDSNE